MVDGGGDDSFKRPGAVPFNWEIRPGVPKTRPEDEDDDDDDDDDDDPILLLPPLRLKPLPPPSSNPPISDYKTRAISPFAPPPSPFKLIKPPPDPDSPNHSGPPTPYFRSYPPRERHGSGSAYGRWRFLKLLFGSKKSSNVKKTTTGQESTSSESDNFYESESTFSTSEDSSRGSVSTRWSSPKSSLSSLRGSPLKRNQSDLSSYEKKTIIMMARDRLA